MLWTINFYLYCLFFVAIMLWCFVWNLFRTQTLSENIYNVIYLHSLWNRRVRLAKGSGFFPHALKIVQINYIYSDNVCILPIKSGHPVIYQLKEMKPSVSPVYIYISMEFFFPEKIKFICTIVDSYWFPRLPVIALSNTEV